MKPRERVFAALQHKEPDRVPRFEIWIDGLLAELGQDDPYAAYANLGQDCVMLPSQTPAGSNAWRNGVDEFGRYWKDGMYHNGRVDTEDDLRHYTPPLDYVEQFFDPARAAGVKRQFPDHCIIFGTHIGPFTAGFMAMGFERFFLRLVDDPDFVRRLLDVRTEWCIAMFRKAVSLGAEVIVLGDDSAYKEGPMISPKQWRKFILPLHERIVAEVGVPMIWHSDGNIEALLPMAIEAGFVGVHALEPAAGMNLDAIKQKFGRDLVLIGNVDVRALCDSDLDAVRREVDRCIAQGAPGGGYMLASCNSIFAGMNPQAVAEFFRYASQVGVY